MLQTNILFVDETNNDRSILAEAYFNRDHGNEARAFSAGFEPEVKLDRHVIEILREEGISPEDFCPKPVDIFLQPYSPRIDLVVGFTPALKPFTMPMFQHRPAVLYLNVDPSSARVEHPLARKRAFRDCYADLGLAIDRAIAKGRLPSMKAA